MNIREKILSNFKSAGSSGVSMVELTRGCEEGSWAIVLKEKLYAWEGLTKEFVDAFWQLVDDKILKVNSCSLLIYLVDGKALTLPVAKRLQNYKSDHWLPVTLCKGEKYER